MREYPCGALALVVFRPVRGTGGRALALADDERDACVPVVVGPAAAAFARDADAVRVGRVDAEAGGDGAGTSDDIGLATGSDHDVGRLVKVGRGHQRHARGGDLLAADEVVPSRHEENLVPDTHLVASRSVLDVFAAAVGIDGDSTHYYVAAALANDLQAEHICGHARCASPNCVEARSPKIPGADYDLGHYLPELVDDAIAPHDPTLAGNSGDDAINRSEAEVATGADELAACVGAEKLAVRAVEQPRCVDGDSRVAALFGTQRVDIGGQVLAHEREVLGDAVHTLRHLSNGQRYGFGNLRRRGVNLRRDARQTGAISAAAGERQSHQGEQCDDQQRRMHLHGKPSRRTYGIWRV